MTLEQASGARAAKRAARPGEGEALSAAPESAPLLVGVLALQGDFAAHAAALGRGRARVCEVRRAAELAGCDALVLPGGESTTLMKLLRAFGLWDPLRDFAAQGRAILGTCAGLILCSREVLGPPQASLGLLPITVVRNAYGRQVDSFVAAGRVRVPADLRHELGGGESFATDFVFIRAPRLTRVAPEVEILAEHDGDPVLVRHGAILGASFHPELSSDGRLIELFLALARHARERGANPRVSGRASRPRMSCVRAAERLFAPARGVRSLPAPLRREPAARRDGLSAGSRTRSRSPPRLPHFGEEPPLSGTRGAGTVFFGGCNLRCAFCQNRQISRLEIAPRRLRPEALAREFLRLQELGCHNIELVTPTHLVPQILLALGEAAAGGLTLPVAYNTGGYDALDVLRELDGAIDIYLPDVKYADAGTARELSGAPDYWEVARAAVLEMHRQAPGLELDDAGIARRGLIVRHLVLPNELAGSETRA